MIFRPIHVVLLELRALLFPRETRAHDYCRCRFARDRTRGLLHQLARECRLLYRTPAHPEHPSIKRKYKRDGRRSWPALCSLGLIDSDHLGRGGLLQFVGRSEG